MESEQSVGQLLWSSPEIDQLVGALVAAQIELPTVKKDSVNPFFKSKYANLTDVVETVKPIIGKHGLAVPQFISSRDGMTTLKTFLVHSSGQWMGDEMVLHLGKNTAQDQGSAVTYARRYAYCAALGIVADEDDDGQSASQPARTPVTKTQSQPAATTTRTRQAPVATGVSYDDSEPSPVTTIAAATGGGASEKSMKRLFALLNGAKELSKERPARLAWASAILNKEIDTFDNLTQSNVSFLMDELEGKHAAPTSDDARIEYAPGEEPY